MGKEMLFPDCYSGQHHFNTFLSSYSTENALCLFLFLACIHLCKGSIM